MNRHPDLIGLAALTIAQIAIDAAGNALAEWNQSNGIRYNIWSNRYE